MSTGTPAKSKSPEPQAEPDDLDFELDDHPAPPRTPLQIRDFTEVKSRSAFEQQVLTVLEEEFSRLDDIARAASRFERQTLELMKNQRLADGYTDDDAGDLTSVFDVKDFTGKAEHLVEISTLSRVVGMLGLGQYRDDIVLRLIAQKFAAPGEVKEKETRDVYLGTYEQAMTHQLRAAKENK